MDNKSKKRHLLKIYIYSKFFFIPILLSMGICKTSSAECSMWTHGWGSMEYLNWWVQDSPIGIPLITENNNPTALGLINEPGTHIIFGAGSNRNTFTFPGINGGRVTIGGWINNYNQYGIEGSGFGLLQSKNSFSASSVNSNIPIINIPFFSIQSNEDVLVNKLPNTATVSDTFQSFGFELNTLYNFYNHTHFPLLFLLGIRYINLTEKLKLNDAIFQTPSHPNSIVNVNDNFSTRNNFYGLQIGTRSNFVYQKLFFDVTAKIAIGTNYQKLTIKGETNIDNIQIIQPIGLFAEPSNIGTFKNKKFAIAPELQARISYNFCKNLYPFISYNIIYINKVIRPGKQIDRTINQTQNSLLGGTGVLVGPSVPSPTFNNTNMWLQGLSAGLAFNF